MSSRIRMNDADPGGSAVLEEQRRPEPAAQEPEPREPEPQPEPGTRREPEPREPIREPGEGTDEGAEPEEDPRSAAQRIRRLTREKYEAERRAQEAEARFRQTQQPQQPPPGSASEAEQRAFQRFQAQQQEYEFAQRCNGLWDRGCAEYTTGEMTEAKAALDAVGWGNTPDALWTLTELPDGHRIYRELASDLDEAARILRLPHDQRTLALSRLSRQEPRQQSQAEGLRNLPPPVSRAPEPHRPVSGTAARREMSLDDPRMSMAEFIRRRDREERGSRIAR